MIQINQLKLPCEHRKEEMLLKVSKLLKCAPSEIIDVKISRKSIDARRKPQIFFIYTVLVTLKNQDNEQKLVKYLKNKDISIASDKEYQIPIFGNQILPHRPVIIGSGPAGLFCAYMLAEWGYRPIIFERGECVEKRLKSVEAFWLGEALKKDSNVQFGEGGAGTFSDGKLNTLVKDPCGRNKKVLEIFVKHGAPEQIAYDYKPHIGTDILTSVIQSMRETIIKNGGEIYFDHKMTDIVLKKVNAYTQIEKIIIEHEGKREVINCNPLVLALGHSARDTFFMLHEKEIPMEAKAFAVGVRIEHPQKLINQSQYGIEEHDILGAASYKLAATLDNGRGVYSFCMCPGGYVVNASSEEGRLAVNGMSYHDRNSIHANSAIVVTVTPKDYGKKEDVLSGIRFQQKLEDAAYQAGKGNIPVQRFEDFCKNRKSTVLTEMPCMKGNYTPSNVRTIFPEEIAASIEKGIFLFDRKINGFADKDTLLSGVESRTSSPVRITRNNEFESEVQGIYPCGEGAGYAGGITSAAMDGIKVAEAIVTKYRRFDI